MRPLPPRRQQWSLCAATALRAQGVNVDVRATGRGGKPKHRSGAQNRRTRVPKGNPGTRAGSQRARRGSQGGLQPKPPGPGGTGPGLPSRHPRSRRTSRGFPRGGRRVQQPLQVEPMSHQSKPPAVRKQRELSLRSWGIRFEKLTAAEMRLSRLSQLCPAPDRCRDRTCRRRKSCRRVAAATVAVEVARARLAAARGK